MKALDGLFLIALSFRLNYQMLNLKRIMLFQNEEFEIIRVYYGAYMVSGNILICNYLTTNESII